MEGELKQHLNCDEIFLIQNSLHSWHIGFIEDRCVDSTVNVYVSLLLVSIPSNVLLVATEQFYLLGIIDKKKLKFRYSKVRPLFDFFHFPVLSRLDVKSKVSVIDLVTKMSSTLGHPIFCLNHLALVVLFC